MLKRAPYYLLLLLIVFAQIACEKDKDKNQQIETETVSASGKAWSVTIGEVTIPSATISILEYPELSAVTDSNGEFSFSDLTPGTEVTFRLDHPDFVESYSETFTLDTIDLNKVSFQVPNYTMYNIMTQLSQTIIDKSKGQIASTVSTEDPNLFVHLGFPGEAGCTVTIDPLLPDSLGPIYFTEQTLPIRSLTETTVDGGILYVNVPPGEYTITAHKAGIEFRQLKVKVIAGGFTNGPPPWGLRKKID